jgi:multidrug efflux pump subunit AcrA (membrane-fusion protein)
MISLYLLNSVNFPPSLNALTRDPTRSENFRKVPSWLLPVAIGLGFCLLFFALFGGRLLPAPEVQVAVVLASAGEDSGTSAAPGQLLFQASGWIEAAPFPSKATALVDGVVESVAVLEGQDVLEGQLLATLIDADARLAHAIAEQAHQTLLAERAVHLAVISAAEKRLLADRKSRWQAPCAMRRRINWHALSGFREMPFPRAISFPHACA